MDLSDKTVLVAGLGISGRSMMEVLRSRAARVIGVDEHKPEADLHSFDDIDWDSADIVMTSPVFNRARRSSSKPNAEASPCTARSS